MCLILQTWVLFTTLFLVYSWQHPSKEAESDVLIWKVFDAWEVRSNMNQWAPTHGGVAFKTAVWILGNLHRYKINRNYRKVILKSLDVLEYVGVLAKAWYSLGVLVFISCAHKLRPASCPADLVHPLHSRRWRRTLHRGATFANWQFLLFRVYTLFYVVLACSRFLHIVHVLATCCPHLVLACCSWLHIKIQVRCCIRLLHMLLCS
jgi:hypothetical protein